MEGGERRITELGPKVRDALDSTGGDAAGVIRAAREGLLAWVANGELGRAWPEGRRRWTSARAIVLGLAGLAAATAVVVWWRLPVTFRVGPDGPAGRLGDLIEAAGTAPVPLRFSEGSSIVVGARGRLRVLAADAGGARLLVERGPADVAIRHRPRRGTRWQLEAGSFRVLVTGTRFHVDFSPERQTLAIDQQEGAILVSGPCLPEPLRVEAGQTARLSCLPVASPPADEPASTAPAPIGTRAAPVAAPAAAAVAASPPLAPATRVGWRELIAAGRYAEGLRAAERAGFARACQSAAESELAALADAARFSGRQARAVEALQALRRRYPRSEAAATAAFALGRIAFEQGGSYDAAVRWFSTYAAERPSGPLIGDAVGRLMEARQRAGDRAGARADAERYLGRFPEGPYAGFARAILAE